MFIVGVKISCSKEVNLLGTTTGNQLKFKKHIEDLCKKASYSLHALRSLRPYLTVNKARILSNSFIDNQFNYAPLIWMFAGKTTINKICKIHYRTLVYNNFTDSHDTLLSVHLRYLAVKVYKTVVEINPKFTWTLRKGRKTLDFSGNKSM